MGTDKLRITDSKNWTDEEKAAFAVGNVVGTVASAVLTGGAAGGGGAAGRHRQR